MRSRSSPPAGQREREGRTAPALAAQFDLVLFEHDPARLPLLIGEGIRSFLVDWEYSAKPERQQGFDTEIAPRTVEDLRAVAAVAGASAWCRVNGPSAGTRAEVEAAVACGADGVFLPMVRRPLEVESFLRVLDGRCAAGILVETVEALAAARDLAAFRLARVYFGLNDFAISRGGGSIFRAVLDGSVERAREAFAGTSFGFAGLTAMDAGHPVPCRLLLAEMARLDCQFSFLRRSFRRDLKSRALPAVVAGIRQAWQHCLARDADAVRRDRESLHEVLRGLD